MGRILQRDPVEVRTHAIQTAMKKYDEGCISCAASYLSLAKERGATLADIARAGVNRRGFLRFATVALAAGAAATLISTRTANAAPVQGTYKNNAADVPGYWGVDGCTTPTAGSAADMPLQFYIAELGAGAYNVGCFDAETSGFVGQDYTHGYWGLAGPVGATDPFAYGQEQARAAVEAWNNTPGVAGITIFADVEAGFGGWYDPPTAEQQAEHAALLNGFLTAITDAHFVPGIYINNYCRDTWFPTGYTAPVAFVYWLAGGKYAGTMCAPCAMGCDTMSPVATAWDAEVQHATFAGQKAVLWQYWLSDGGCAGDFNYSMQSGYRTFQPNGA
jgi:hypothetical protein